MARTGCPSLSQAKQRRRWVTPGGPGLRSVAPASGTALALSSSAASSEAKSKLTGVGQILFKCHDDQSMKHSV